MRTRRIGVIALVALALAGCSNDQSDVADAMIEQAADAGMGLDEQCVHGVAEGLSDDDVRSLEEGSDLATSAEGEAVLARMVIECGSVEEIADVFLGDLPTDMIDPMCVAESLKAADLGAGVESALTNATTECLSLEG